MATALTMSPTSLMHPYTMQAFTHLQEIYGEDRLNNFEQFATYYNNLLSAELKLPMSHNVTLHVRLNPFCSAHTRLLVDIKADGWYQSLCSDLGVTGLKTRLGKELSSLSFDELLATDSILVAAKTPLAAPTSLEGFLPIEAPFKYSPTRSEYAQLWFNSAVETMSFAIATHIHNTLPSVFEHTANPEAALWGHVVGLIGNKKDMQTLLSTAFGQVDTSDWINLGTISDKTKQDIMAHVYRSLINTVNSNEMEIRTVLVQDALDMVKQRINTLAQAKKTGLPVAGLVSLSIGKALPAILDDDLFETNAKTTSVPVTQSDSVSSLDVAIKNAAILHTDLTGIIDMIKKKKADWDAKRATKKNDKSEKAVALKDIHARKLADAKAKQDKTRTKKTLKDTKKAHKKDVYSQLETTIGNMILGQSADLVAVHIVNQIGCNHGSCCAQCKKKPHECHCHHDSCCAQCKKKPHECQCSRGSCCAQCKKKPHECQCSHHHDKQDAPKAEPPKEELPKKQAVITAAVAAPAAAPLNEILPAKSYLPNMLAINAIVNTIIPISAPITAKLNAKNLTPTILSSPPPLKTVMVTSSSSAPLSMTAAVKTIIPISAPVTIQCSPPPPLKTVVPFSFAIPVMSMVDFRYKFGKNYALAMRYLFSAPSSEFAVNKSIAMFKDDAFGANTTIKSIKESFTKKPAEMHIESSFTLEGWGAGSQVFHMVK